MYLSIRTVLVATLFLGALVFCYALYRYADRISDLFRTSAAEHYAQYCASCHDQPGQGFRDRTWLHGKSWNEIYRSIRYGYPDNGMPAFDTAFSERELEEMVRYILEILESSEEERLDTGPSLEGTIESEDLAFRLDEVATGLGVPWGLAFLPGGDMLITERSGELRRVSPVGELRTISGLPEVKARGQGGLLDIAIHPDYPDTPWIYLSFSKPEPGNSGNATTAVVRGKLEGDRLAGLEEIFEAKPYLPTNRHYGSRLQFDRDGYLFVSVGDRGRRDQNPQDLGNHCGKIHRIHPDGSIPPDNPFVAETGAVASIYSYGHRNPQGLAWHPETGVLWEHEHGPRGGDEINRIRRGKNFGWPVISYGINYSGTKFTDLTEKEGMEQPEIYWVPSIAPSGMDFVTHSRYGAWEGDLFSGSLSFGYLHRSKMEKGRIVGEEKLLKNIGRVRNVRMGPDGYLYVAVEGPGRIYRLVPEAETPAGKSE